MPVDHSHHSHHGSHSDLGMSNDSNLSAIISNDQMAAVEGSTAHSNHMLTGMGMDMDMGGMGGMKMYFHFGVEETILFYGWKISTVGGLIGSMVGIFLIALFYEGLKYFREFLFRKSLSSIKYSSTSNSSTEQPVQMHILSPSHFLQTLLHMIQFIISYCLMLIFMTYNVWLCLALALGAGTGYFLFGWKKSVVVDVTEHCH